MKNILSAARWILFDLLLIGIILTFLNSASELLIRNESHQQYYQKENRHEPNETLYPCSLTPSHDLLIDPLQISKIATETKVVFFNRVPKAGSGLARFVMEDLSKQNDFVVHVDGATPQHPTKNCTIGAHNIDKRLLSWIAADRNTLLIGHIHFVDFPALSNIEMPFYINIVREPIQRLVSQYYFNRFKTSHVRPNMSDADRYRTFDDCVKEQEAECSTPHFISVIVPYFCGQDPVCESGSYSALQMAKRNVMRSYSVVGYMARLDDFFVALEYMIPTFFKNATVIYKIKQERAKTRRTQGDTKINPSKETVEYLKTKIPYEYEFYYFIRSRFDCLMKRIEHAKGD